MKLSGPLAQPIGGSVGYALATPDGSRVVYFADQEVDDLFELYSAPVDGSAAAVKISDPSQGSVHWLRGRFLPDGQTLLYLTHEPALYRAPIDGSAAPLELAGDIAFQDMSEFRFHLSADGQWVVFREDSPERLWAVRTDGSMPPVSLAPPGAVAIGTDFLPSPDSTRVAFRSKGASTGFELYSVPIDGSAAPVRLNVAFGQPNERVSQFRFTPDGASVVHVVHDVLIVPDGYGGFAEFPRDYRLFRAASDGSAAAVALGAVFPEAVEVSIAAVTAERALYLADAIVDERAELYSVPVDGGSGAVRLNGDHPSMGPAGVRFGVQTTADGRLALYRTYDRELFVAPVDRAGGAVALSWSGVYVDEFVLANAAGRVLYEGQLAGSDDTDLFSAALPTDPRRRSLVNRVVRLARDVNSFQLHPDGTTVLCHDYSPNHLWRLDVFGREEPIELVSGSVLGYAAIAGERALYWSYPPLYQPTELYSVPLGGGAPVRLNSTLAIGPVLGRIRNFATSADGEWTVYVADGEVPQQYELYSVPSDGSLPAAKLSDGFGRVGGVDPAADVFRITPDGTRVVYLSSQGSGGTHDLLVVPIDGSSPPTRLTEATYYGGVQPGFEVAPDGARVVFRIRLPTGPFSATERLATVGLDGSAPYLLLNATPVIGGTVLSFAISPDSSRVVYLSSEQFAQRFELLSVSIEGGPVAELQHSASFSHRVFEYRICADGSRVVYVFQGLGNKWLYSIPIDASAPAQAFASSESVRQFAFTPDGLGVVFIATGNHLFRAPLDASTEVQLNPAPAPGWDGGSPGFQISPDGSRVVFVSDQETDGVMGLFSVPMDGSQTLVRLSGPPVPGASYWHRLYLDAGSNHAVYLTDADDFGTHELYSVPIAGGEAPTRLNRPIPAGGGFDLDFFEEPPIALAGRRVAFALDGEVPGRTELYVSLSGRAPAIAVNGPLHGNAGEELPFAFAGSNRLVYVAAEDQAGVPELFARSFTTHSHMQQR